MTGREAEDLARRSQVLLGRGRSPSQPIRSVDRWRGRCPETRPAGPLLGFLSGPKSCPEQHKERGQGMGTLLRVSHRPDQPSQGFPPSPSPVPTQGPHQGWPYSWSRRGEQTSVFTTVTMSPTAALVCAKHSFMFSVILFWGWEGGTSTGKGSKRQRKRGEWWRGQSGVPWNLVTLPAIPRGSS